MRALTNELRRILLATSCTRLRNLMDYTMFKVPFSKNTRLLLVIHVCIRDCVIFCGVERIYTALYYEISWSFGHGTIVRLPTLLFISNPAARCSFSAKTKFARELSSFSVRREKSAQPNVAQWDAPKQRGDVTPGISLVNMLSYPG